MLRTELPLFAAFRAAFRGLSGQRLSPVSPTHRKFSPKAANMKPREC